MNGQEPVMILLLFVNRYCQLNRVNKTNVYNEYTLKIIVRIKKL